MDLTQGRGSTTERVLKPDTLQSYLSALRSVHVDRRLPTDVFESEWLHRIVMGIRRLTPHEFKARAAPITLDILEKITSPDAPTADELISTPLARSPLQVFYARASSYMTTVSTERPSKAPVSLAPTSLSPTVLGSSAVKLTLYSKESTSYSLPLAPLHAQSMPFANSSNWTHVQTMHLSSTSHIANSLTTPSSQLSKSESIVRVSLTQLRTKAIASAEAPPSKLPITVSLTQISNLLDVGLPKPLRLI